MAGSESQGWDKPATQAFSEAFMHVFFNLDVFFCFCILHPPAAVENTRTDDLLASSSSSQPLITPLQTRLQCPRLCAIRGPHIWVCDIRGSRRRQWGGETEGVIERQGGWIDGWRLDSQRDDGRWIKGEIERDCRQRAVWQYNSAAIELHKSRCMWHSPWCGLNTQQSVSTDKLITLFETQSLERWKMPISKVLKVPNGFLTVLWGKCLCLELLGGWPDPATALALLIRD